VPPSGTALAEQKRPRLALVEPPPPRVVDVALWYGERSGGIRTYLDAKVAWASRSGAVEHHLVVPGREHRTDGSLHEVRAVTVVAANGYRIPFDRWRCWRGAAWIVTAWLLVPPLRRLGYESEADRIVSSLATAALRHGLREYYNPLTGAGEGARRFGMATLLLELL